MTKMRSITILKIICIAWLFSLAICTKSERLQNSNGVVNQLDKKVRAIFNERSALSRYRTADKESCKLFYLEYESGFTVTLNMTDKNLAIVQYHHGAAKRKEAGSYSEQNCNRESQKTRSSSQVDAYLRKINEVEPSCTLASFKILNDGYLTEYQKGSTKYIIELNSDLKIRRRESITKSLQQSQSEIDSKTQESIISFVSQSLGFKQYKNVQVEKFYRLGPNTYQLLYILSIRGKNVKYQVTINFDRKTLTIEEAKFIINFTPSYVQDAKYDEQLVRTLDYLVKSSTSDKTFADYKISKIERDDPMFRIFYIKGRNLVIIELVFDQIRKRVEIIRKQSSIIQVQEEVRTARELSSTKKSEIFSFVSQSFGRAFPKDAQLEKITRVGQGKYIVFVVIVIRQRQVRYQVIVNENSAGGYGVEDAQFVFDFTPSYQEWTDLESLKDVDELVRRGLPEKLPAGYRLSRVERDDPYFRFYYTFGASKYQVDFTFDPFARKVFVANIRSETVSEPTILKETTVVKQVAPIKEPIISQTTVLTKFSELDTITYQLIKYSEIQIDNIFLALQKQFKDFNFKNSRVVRVQKISYGFRLIIMIDENLYESVLRFNSTTGEYKLLRWRKVSQKESQSTDAFFDYINISLDKDLQLILLKTFPREKLGHVKRIIEAKNRVTSDGLYYQISLETDSDNQYLVNIYYKPEDDFTEVLSYEQTNSKFYISKQELNSLAEEIKSIEPSSSDLLKVFEFINNKFGSFSSANVVYIYKIFVTRLNITIYLVGLRTSSGLYYELSIACSSTDVSLLKYSKIFEGYSVLVDTADSNRVAQFYSKQTQFLNINSAEVSGILVKDIPLIGRFYRLVFAKKTRYSIIVYVNTQGVMRINGAEPIPTYYDLLINANFKGYGELSSLIGLCRNYQLPVQTKPTKVLVTDYDYGYDARQDMNCLRYRQSDCIMCSYRFYSSNGRCLPVPDSCKDYNRETGECYSCYTGYWLSAGQCAVMHELCQSVDSNGRCIKCYKQYSLIEGKCFRSQIRISNLKRESYDQLCEEERNGQCTRCAIGSYLSRKQMRCVIKDPFADQFDEINEVVIKCARGCVLSGGQCIRSK